MDLHYYQTCLDAILKSSSKAKIFCLIHKMDLIAEDQRELIFNAKAQQLEKHSKPLSCNCFSTSVSVGDYRRIAFWKYVEGFIGIKKKERI